MGGLGPGSPGSTLNPALGITSIAHRFHDHRPSLTFFMNLSFIVFCTTKHRLVKFNISLTAYKK